MFSHGLGRELRNNQRTSLARLSSKIRIYPCLAFVTCLTCMFPTSAILAPVSTKLRWELLSLGLWQAWSNASMSWGVRRSFLWSFFHPCFWCGSWSSSRFLESQLCWGIVGHWKPSHETLDYGFLSFEGFRGICRLVIQHVRNHSSNVVLFSYRNPCLIVWQPEWGPCITLIMRTFPQTWLTRQASL